MWRATSFVTPVGEVLPHRNERAPGLEHDQAGKSERQRRPPTRPAAKHMQCGDGHKTSVIGHDMHQIGKLFGAFKKCEIELHRAEQGQQEQYAGAPANAADK